MTAADPRSSTCHMRAELVEGRVVQGHVVDVADLSMRLVIEILADGLPVALMRANLFDERLGKDGVGDGCYGFAVALTDDVLASAQLIEVRLANTGVRVGAPIDLRLSLSPVPDGRQVGHVAWAGGLIIEGRLPVGRREGEPSVKAMVDGRVVAQTIPRDWTHVQRGDHYDVARAFRLNLPREFADGRLRQIGIEASDGTSFAGSPCAVVAFDDGLRRFITDQAELASETIRASLFDALFPQSVPFEAFEAWQRRFPTAAARPDREAPIAVVLVGSGDVSASLKSLERQSTSRWVAAALEDAAGGPRFRPDDLQEFLEREAHDCDLIVFASVGTQFVADAMRQFQNAFAAFPQARSAYSDYSVVESGHAYPLLLSAFDYERCLAQGYCAMLFAMRREAVQSGLQAGARCLFRLFNAQFDGPIDEARLPVHCPEILAQIPMFDPTARLAGLAAANEAHRRTQSARTAIGREGSKSSPSPKAGGAIHGDRVTVIIPAGYRLEPLLACLTALHATTALDAVEIIVACPAGRPPLQPHFTSKGFKDITVVDIPADANLSRANNLGARAASTDVILFLGTDSLARNRGWLQALLGRLAQPDVGAVGPLIVWPSGVVRHAGYVLGPHLCVADAFGDRMEGEAGYAGLLGVTRECSAVSSQALLTRRQLYLDVGGMDEIYFSLFFGDVDFCLKLRQGGYRVVVTPDARLSCAEPSPARERPDLVARRTREVQNLRHRWGNVLLADPFYHPCLALDGHPFSALAWPPRPRHPRQRTQPAALPIPFGL